MIETAISSEAYNWMNKFKKPLLITEYGADTIAGLHMVKIKLNFQSQHC